MAAENKQNCIDYITVSYIVDESLDNLWASIDGDNLKIGYDLVVLDCAALHGVDTANNLKKPVGKSVDQAIATYTMDRLNYYEQSGGKDKQVFARINNTQDEAFNQAQIIFGNAPAPKRK